MTSMIEPSMRHEAITPSDTDDLPKYSNIVISGAGDVVFEDRSGNVLTYSAVPAYTQFTGFAPLRVRATGTTATGIVGWRYEG